MLLLALFLLLSLLLSHDHVSAESKTKIRVPQALLTKIRVPLVSHIRRGKQIPIVTVNLSHSEYE